MLIVCVMGEELHGMRFLVFIVKSFVLPNRPLNSKNGFPLVLSNLAHSLGPFWFRHSCVVTVVSHVAGGAKKRIRKSLF